MNAHSLFSKWFSESGKMVMAMFARVREILDDGDSFVCILIDEVESLTAARQAASSGSEPSDAIRVVNALLTQLDQLKRYPNALVLTTSNITGAIGRWHARAAHTETRAERHAHAPRARATRTRHAHTPRAVRTTPHTATHFTRVQAALLCDGVLMAASSSLCRVGRERFRSSLPAKGRGGAATCTTSAGGWLSGYSPTTRASPPPSYAVAGVDQDLDDGITDLVVCFDQARWQRHLLHAHGRLRSEVPQRRKRQR